MMKMFTGIIWLVQALVALIAGIMVVGQMFNDGIDSGTLIALVLALWAMQWGATVEAF